MKSLFAITILCDVFWWRYYICVIRLDSCGLIVFVHPVTGFCMFETYYTKANLPWSFPYRSPYFRIPCSKAHSTCGENFNTEFQVSFARRFSSISISVFALSSFTSGHLWPFSLLLFALPFSLFSKSPAHLQFSVPVLFFRRHPFISDGAIWSQLSSRVRPQRYTIVHDYGQFGFCPVIGIEVIANSSSHAS